MNTPPKTAADNTNSNHAKTTGHSTRAATKNSQLTDESAKGASTLAVPLMEGKTAAVLQPKPGALSQKALAIQHSPSLVSSALQGHVEPANLTSENSPPLHEEDPVLLSAPSLMYLMTISSISSWVPRTLMHPWNTSKSLMESLPLRKS